ncbi:hypothetical protein BDF20DRAFT_862655 [Mycotypha africana]|uniref:uncharacterized protein n=1 Tax=Mycotypha africana TaxID=64632 RepID=UPI002301D8A9|nr:uncharacterized protein BDF20DRAFT_862655 [Mycotypha africana]KAI8981681.1 hypothetical protein BDF20DRAFT_862655 [Mycotypha africana]
MDNTQRMRPARVQVSQAELDEYLREKRPEGGTYNIWHHRYSGLERDFHRHSVRPKFKVNIARDSGETLGSKNKNAYFCLFFAKGMCAKGHNCTMWHRIPTENDMKETTIDCFGRDKFTDFRQDMGGVGGFMRENRTLYVGRIAQTKDIEDAVRRQFGQFGPLERVRILRGRGVAFVTYKTRANAEFAREAMMNQSLEHNEILNVRWATADPKAANRLNMKDRSEQEMLEAMEAFENGEFDEQDNEAELPAEFTSVKRALEKDESAKLEESSKKQKAESETVASPTYNFNATYEYSQEDYDRYYQQYYQQLQEQQKRIDESEKVGGIIPQKVITNLKEFSKNNTVTSSKDISKPQNATGALGSLANYGSDSEED